VTAVPAAARLGRGTTSSNTTWYANCSLTRRGRDAIATRTTRAPHSTGRVVCCTVTTVTP